MEGSNYWSTFDAASAYWSIPLSEGDKEKTAFSVPRGKFEFNVTPYGLCNAGSTYQRMMDMCLSGLRTDRILAYMDDIIVFNKTFEDHLLSLRSLFERLRTGNISLKASKCEVGYSKVNFLGYELSSEGIRPQERLTEAINSFKRPECRKEVRRFIGLTGFYRSFIKNFSEISAPLSRLTSDNVPFTWDKNCENSFLALKTSLLTKPVLLFPRPGEKFFLEVDGSECAVGGVLSQYGSDGQLHPVAFFSSTLTPAQRTWSTHTIETFALVLATRHWYTYLIGTEFTVLSDYNFPQKEICTLDIGA